MKLIFVGTKGEVDTSRQRYESNASLLIEDDLKLLIDYGHTEMIPLEALRPDYIALTHAHPDHVGGLKGEIEVPIIATAEVIERLKEDEDLAVKEFIELKPGEERRIDSWKIEAIPVVHSIRAPAVGYLIEVEGFRIGYFPDYLEIPEKHRHKLSHLDILIADGSAIERDIVRKRDDERFGHASMKTSLKLAKDLNIKRVIFTHFGEEFLGKGERKAREILGEGGVSYDFAWDGRTFVFETQGALSEGRLTMNAPTFAYLAVYGEPPDPPLSGRSGDPERIWRGILVDVHLKDAWLERLNSIDGIEIRSSCEGHSPERVAFIVFRFRDPSNDGKADEVARAISRNEGYFSMADLGAEDRMRIVVAGKTWYGQEDWESWWERLPEVIEKALGEVRGEEISEFRREGYDPSKLRDDQLRDDFRLLVAKYSTMKQGGKTEFEDIEVLEDFALDVIRELIRRDAIVFHPDMQTRYSLELLQRLLPRIVSERETQGIYLVEPHGQMIYNGTKRAIVKSVKFSDLGPFFLLSSNRAFGVIKLDEPMEIDLEKFLALRDRHKITDEERRLWWDDKERLFFYPIRWFVPFNEPRLYKLPKGIQTFVKRVVFEAVQIEAAEDPESLKKLSDEDLLMLHAELHRRFNELPAGATQEPIVNAHLNVIKELKRRGLEHRPTDELDRLTLELLGIVQEQERVYLKDILKLWDQGFYLDSSYICAVGSVAVSGFGKDIDIWVDTTDPRELEIVEFRLRSMLPPELQPRIHVFGSYDVRELTGKPFTNYIVLARKKVEFVPIEERKLIQMARIAGVPPEAERMAEASLKEDKIKPHRYYYPQKAIVGYRKLEEYSIEGLLLVLRDDEWPYFVDQKFDGFRTEIHKTDRRVTVFTEQGRKVDLKLFPELLKEILKIPHDLVVEAELEIWIGDRHLGRSEAAGYINSGEYREEFDKGARANVFECLWFDGKDLHKLPLTERNEYLERLGEETKGFKHFIVIEKRLCHNPKEIEIAIRYFASKPYSEGAMIKSSKLSYPLSGMGRSYTKFKNESDLDAMVVAKYPVVRKADGKILGWRYDCAIRDQKTGKLVPVGRTYNTKFDLKPGDILRVAFVNLNRYVDPKTGEIWFNWWSPRCLPPYQLILTKEGLKEIAKIEKGEFVFDGKGGFKPVEGIFTRPFKGSLIRLRAYGSPPFELTPEHLVLAIKAKRCHRLNGFCYAKNRHSLCENCKQPLHESYELEWIRADQLKPGDLVAFKEPEFPEFKLPTLTFRKFVGNRWYFRIEVDRCEVKPDSRFFYLIGRYIGDGYISKASKNGGKIRISFHSEDETLEEVEKIVKELFPIWSVSRRAERQHCIELYFGGGEVLEFFSRFGKDAASKEIPWKWLGLPSELLEALIKGIADSDGYERRGVTYISTASSKLAVWLILALRRLGRSCSLSISHREGRLPEFKVGYSIQKGKKRLAKFDFLAGYRLAPILSTELVDYQGIVYDLRIPESHSFSVPFVTIHNCIEPREDKKEPDNTDTADRIVAQTHGEVSEKPMPKRWREILAKFSESNLLEEIDYAPDLESYLSLMETYFERWSDGLLIDRISREELQEAIEKLSAAKDEESDEELPPEESREEEKELKGRIKKRPPDQYPKYFSEFQLHFRGRTTHIDWRRKMDGYLEGDTLFAMKEGSIKEPITSVRQAYQWLRENEKTLKFRPDMNPNEKCLGREKARQPLEWLNMFDVRVKPGFVGATRNYPGVFILHDAGMCYPGARKPYFEEYFLDMERFKGRTVKRMIPVREEWKEKPSQPLTWQYWTNVKDQTPYILTRRARMQKDYVPPPGHSALPPWWEEKIPKELRWWEDEKLGEEERLKRIDLAYNHLIDIGELKGRKIPIREARGGQKGEFVLKHRWWKGQVVVRGMPVENWELFMRFPSDLIVIHFEENPIFNESVAGLLLDLKSSPPGGKRVEDWMDFEGEIPPQTELNPNKSLPARFETLDRGEVQWIEGSDLFWSFRFKGKELVGYYIFKKETSDAQLGIFSRSALPGQKRR